MMMLSGRLMGRTGTALACSGLMVIFLAGVALATDPAETTAGDSSLELDESYSEGSEEGVGPDVFAWPSAGQAPVEEFSGEETPESDFAEVEPFPLVTEVEETAATGEGEEAASTPAATSTVLETPTPAEHVDDAKLAEELTREAAEQYAAEKPEKGVAAAPPVAEVTIPEAPEAAEPAAVETAKPDSASTKKADAIAPAVAPAVAPPVPAPVVVAESHEGEPAAHPKQGMDRDKPIDETPRIARNPDGISTFEKYGHKDGILRVLAGKSLLMDLRSNAKRVSVANPEVAEILIISPRQVMINGLANGETSVIIWDNGGNYKMYTLVVGDQLQDQVMLEVTVAEINRTAMEKHGVDVRSTGGQFGYVTQFGNAAPIASGSTQPPKEGEPFMPFVADGISWAIFDFKNDIAVFFEQMQDENLGRVLAEPKLLARSGKEAKFLSGGEIPIVITQDEDTTIEFKEFGTTIEFVPEVREDGSIDLKVHSEVSEPDFSAGVQLFGFTVPAFITRRADTDVTLENNQSLVIAGLIKETKQEIESKLPFFGDIPYLGYIFRSTEYSKDLLELVIVVKPRLVKPFEAGQRVALPTDRGPLTRKEVRTKPEIEKVSRPRPF